MPLPTRWLLLARARATSAWQRDERAWPGDCRLARRPVAEPYRANRRALPGEPADWRYASGEGRRQSMMPRHRGSRRHEQTSVSCSRPRFDD